MDPQGGKPPDVSTRLRRATTLSGLVPTDDDFDTLGAFGDCTQQLAEYYQAT
jgi:hypothetical protein